MLGESQHSCNDIRKTSCNLLTLPFSYFRRFVDDAFGFALTWNYWFNDAVSTASDLVALQLVYSYYFDPEGKGDVHEAFPGWALSLIFFFILLATNIITVRAYGEVEYWLSLLKVITISVFIVMGIVVNAGGNATGQYIGGKNWHIPGAPFVGGIGGFASVFVTASFACTCLAFCSIFDSPSETNLLLSNRWRNRIHCHYGRRNEEPDQESAARGQECLLANSALLHPVCAAHWSQRALHLREPLQEVGRYFTIYYCL